MDININSIKKELIKTLDKDRYNHTVGVSYTAMCLAMRYEEKIKNAEIAGLLHDCAKCIPDKKKIKMCLENNIEITNVEMEHPYLLHSKLGAYIAESKYNVDDQDILNSIIKHTTGSDNMTMLEKIVYVADYIEPKRYKAANLTEVRKLAFTDIDMAVYVIMRDTINYLNSKGNVIDNNTNIAYTYYKDLIDNRNKTQLT